MKDGVITPKHYEFFDEDSLPLLAAASTVDEWRGFCRCSALKYRLRCGKKDDVQKEIDKAMNFEFNVFSKYKHLCKQQDLIKVINE